MGLQSPDPDRRSGFRLPDREPTEREAVLARARDGRLSGPAQACQASIPRTTRAGWPSTSEPSPSGRRKRISGVVEPEQVQEGGVVVGVGHDVLDRLVAELVGRARGRGRP